MISQVTKIIVNKGIICVADSYEPQALVYCRDQCRCLDLISSLVVVVYYRVY